MTTWLAEQVLREQAEWQAFAAAALPPRASLLYVCRHDSNRRVYRAGARVAKVLRRGAAPPPLDQQLGREYTTLAGLDARAGTTYRPTFYRHREWEVLEMDAVEGEPLGVALAGRPPLDRIALRLRVARAVLRVNRRGVTHGDLNSSNILVGASDAVHLLDFGKAGHHRPAHAVWSEGEHLLLHQGGAGRRWLKGAVALRLAPVRALYQRRQRRLSAPVRRGPSSMPDLERLMEVWADTVRWRPAAAQWLSPYSLSVAGWHFNGWRPWPWWWERVRESVSFAGKSVLDIGDELGLLGAFALLAGARGSYIAGRGPTAIAASRAVAGLLGVQPTFAEPGLDLWPAACRFADVAAILSPATSPRAERGALRLLEQGGWPEALVATRSAGPNAGAALHRVGYTTVTPLIRSERYGTLLYATRAPAPPQAPLDPSSGITVKGNGGRPAPTVEAGVAS
ncbi:MAG: phosphotransferase [Dehalococcoidia bacterium]